MRLAFPSLLMVALAEADKAEAVLKASHAPTMTGRHVRYVLVEEDSDRTCWMLGGPQ